MKTKKNNKNSPDRAYILIDTEGGNSNAAQTFKTLEEVEDYIVDLVDGGDLNVDELSDELYLYSIDKNFRMKRIYMNVKSISVEFD